VTRAVPLFDSEDPTQICLDSLHSWGPDELTVRDEILQSSRIHETSHAVSSNRLGDKTSFHPDI